MFARFCLSFFFVPPYFVCLPLLLAYVPTRQNVLEETSLEGSNFSTNTKICIWHVCYFIKSIFFGPAKSTPQSSKAMKRNLQNQLLLFTIGWAPVKHVLCFVTCLLSIVVGNCPRCPLYAFCGPQHCEAMSMKWLQQILEYLSISVPLSITNFNYLKLSSFLIYWVFVTALPFVLMAEGLAKALWN